MPVRGRCLPKENASNARAKANSLSGDQHAKIIGSQAVARKKLRCRSRTATFAFWSAGTSFLYQKSCAAASEKLQCNIEKA